MKPYKHDAMYLFEHYKQSGMGLANELFNRIIKEKQLKVMEVSALKHEFNTLIKEDKK